jgi:hypothetical protein
VTIGQLAPGSPPPVACDAGPRDEAQPTVTSGNAYVVPPLPPASALVVTSWSHSAAAGAGQMLTMKMFRQVAGSTYMAVGHDGPRALAPGTVNTFPASIAVKPGDVLGVNNVNAGTVNNACYFAALGESFLERVGDLADGASGAFGSGSNGRVNATAVVAPDNRFTLGDVDRNKKKGTATLTVNVPNPGELALSGNGLKTASAAGAVVAKTVTAPGDVKLKIRAKGKKKRKLNETGKVKVKPNITFTPTGGDPAMQSRKLKLKKR